MLRGTIKFTCDNCKKKFMGLDIEYMCTCLSNPQKCPYCGSFHTMPCDEEFLDRSLYVSIWEDMDKSGKRHVTCYYEQSKLEKSIDECNEWNKQHEEGEAAEEVENKKKSSKDKFHFLNFFKKLFH